MKTLKLSAMAGAISAVLVPQHGEAAIVTVGGDGGTGSVVLGPGNWGTNLGGLLNSSVQYYQTFDSLSSTGSASLYMNAGVNTGGLGYAVRSSATTTGSGPHLNNWRFSVSGSASEGALFDSSDNWLPGVFSVSGVNSGVLIWGWLHIKLGDSSGNFKPEILSFTYDDAATDDTPFAKPIGGFSVGSPTEVPEPSTVGLMGLALGAAGVVGLRRRRKQR